MRYVKRTVSAGFKDHRPAMVPDLPAAIEAAELRARLERITDRENLTWDRIGEDN